MLSFSLPFAKGEARSAGATFAPNAFVRIERDGQIVLTMPYVEMGQGTYTSIPMLIAEELEVDLKQVRLEHAPPDEKLYVNPLLGVQATGNSNAIRGAWQPLRQAGATARTMLVAAAARRWNVDPSTCRAERGEVIHAPSGRRLGYSELAADAARMPLPENVALKRPQDFKLIGTPAKRLDTPSKVNGTAVFGIDVRPPGVKIATLAQSPVFGGRVKRVDDAAARAVKGVRQIVVLDDVVAVVADHMGAAKKGLAALVIEWDDGPHAGLTTDAIAAELEQATLKPGAVAENIGDADRAMASAATKVEASYHVPFLAHATMEPLNCTVHVRKDGCEVWVGNQALARAQAAAAKTAGLPVDQVVVHNHLIGGGFGRRLEADYVVRAVEIAKHVEGPVKVVWTREEDIQHDMYRPMFFDRLSAGLDARECRSPGTIASQGPRSSRDGCQPRSTTVSIPTRPKAPSTSSTTSRTCTSNMCGWNRRAFRPPSGAASVRHTTSSSPKASWTSWRRRRSRIRSRTGSRCSTRRRAPRPCSRSLPRRPAGERSCRPRVGRGVSIQNAFATYMAHVAEVEVVEAGRGSRPARRLRGRLRHHRQSRHRRGADPERGHVRHHRGALWRDHRQERSRRAEQF